MRKTLRDLTQEKLKEILDYNEKTGIFNWRIRRDETGKLRGCGGKIAGCLSPDGYVYIGIDGKLFSAHRLAWLFAHGYFPENQIDHIDQVRHHNWLSNLREATQSCNLQNQKVSTRNKSGVTGVHWHKSADKWLSQITKNKKQINLGFFASLLDAAKARYEAEQKYFDCVIKSSAESYIESYLFDNFQTGDF